MEDKFSYFYKKFNAALVFYAFQMMRDRESAKDCVEESWLKVYEIGGVEKLCPDVAVSQDQENVFQSYIYTTVRNICINKLNSERRRSKLEGEYGKKYCNVYNADNPPPPDHLSTMIRSEMLRLLKEGMNQLPTECKKVFHLMYNNGYTAKEIAEIHGRAVSTIKNQKARGLQILKLIVSEEEVFNYREIKTPEQSQKRTSKSYFDDPDSIHSKVVALKCQGKSNSLTACLVDVPVGKINDIMNQYLKWLKRHRSPSFS